MPEQVLEKLIKKIAKLPGLGPRSSRRVVLYLLRDKETLLLPLIEDMNNVANNLVNSLKQSKVGAVGSTINALDSLGSQIGQVAESFGVSKNFEDKGTGAIDKVMQKNFNLSKEAVNYGKVKSASIKYVDFSIVVGAEIVVAVAAEPTTPLLTTLPAAVIALLKVKSVPTVPPFELT